MDDEVITITLADEDGTVSPEQLIAALGNTIAVLKGLEPHLAVKQESIQWKIVHASMNSPMTISLKPIGKKRALNKARMVAKTMYDGIRAISLHPVRPPHFDDIILEAASKLGGTVDGRGQITIQIPGEQPITPPETVRANAKSVISSTRSTNYQDEGSIEDRLDNILTHDGLSIQVWETLTNLKIDCDLDESQIERATKLLRRRVSISGTIKYRNDKPVSIKVETLQPLRERHQLPQFEDLGPINITGDLLPEDYLRGE